MKAVVYEKYGSPDVLQHQKVRDLGVPLLSVNCVEPPPGKCVKCQTVN